MVVGLHLLRRSYFLPLTKKKKEGDCALPPDKGEGLQDAAAGRPGEPPPPLRKPLKTYPVLSDLSRSPSPPCAPPRAQEFPTLPPKPPRALLEAEENKEFSETKEFLKQMHTQYAEHAPQRKPPQGGLTQARREAEQQGDLELPKQKGEARKREKGNRSHINY